MTVSVVVPAFNEAKGIKRFHETLLSPVVEHLSYDCEIVYINDGSTDDTLAKLHEIARDDSRVVVVNLSRNFGKEIAITAGIHTSKGDVVITLDADGQHPPELINDFLARWEGGAQIVVGVRQKTKEGGAMKRVGSRLFYSIFNSISDQKLIPRSTDYRLIDREVVDQFLMLKEHNRITRGLIDWMGYDTETVEFVASERLAGTATYSFNQLLRLAANSVISLSVKPLVYLVPVGAIVTLMSVLLAVFTLVETLVFADPLNLDPTGTAYLTIFITFLIGVVLIVQGILGVYLSHVHAQSQGRPLFIINSRGSIRCGDNDRP